MIFCKRIHSKWRQIICKIKKDGSVSYVTIQLCVKEDKVKVSKRGRSFTSGGIWSYKTLEVFGGARDTNQVGQQRRCADKTFICLEIKLFIIASGKHRARECLFFIFLKETKMQISDDLVFLWGETLHLESHCFWEALKA